MVMYAGQEHDVSLGDGARLSGHNDAKGIDGRHARTRGGLHVAPAIPDAVGEPGVQQRRLQQVTLGSN